MRKSLFCAMFLAAIAFTTSLAEARGGGGLEYLTNFGSDVFGQMPGAGGRLLDMPTGTVSAVSGFGYGVLRGGYKIGGFGIFFYTDDISQTIPDFGGPLTHAAGGLGGLISGGYTRWGPLAFSLDLRIGAGGMGVNYLWTQAGYDPVASSAAVFVLYGALKAEVGIVFVPAMMVSAFAGLDALVPVGSMGPIPVLVPTAGVRVTWGSF
jgi:hypothetical protein